MTWYLNLLIILTDKILTIQKLKKIKFLRKIFIVYA